MSECPGCEVLREQVEYLRKQSEAKDERIQTLQEHLGLAGDSGLLDRIAEIKLQDEIEDNVPQPPKGAYSAEDVMKAFNAIHTGSELEALSAEGIKAASEAHAKKHGIETPETEGAADGG